MGLQNELSEEFVKRAKKENGVGCPAPASAPATPVRKSPKKKKADDAMSPAKSGSAPKRVRGARPAMFGQAPKADFVLKAAGAQVEVGPEPVEDPEDIMEAKRKKVQQADANLELVSDDDEDLSLSLFIHFYPYSILRLLCIGFVGGWCML